MKNNKIDWRKFWKKFDIWCDDQDPFFGGTKFPDWYKQSREIGKRLIQYYPKLNRKKLWKNLNKKYKDSTDPHMYNSVDDWPNQKRWIREIVEKQINGE